MDQRFTIERRLRERGPISHAELADTALDALDHGLYEAIVEGIEPVLAGGVNDARLFQILGLARRALLDGVEAVAAFQRAAALAPDDPLIAHGLARSTLEAGLPALTTYREARRLAPMDASVLIGEASALVAEDRGDEAISVIESVLAENPGWYEGHEAFSRLAAAARSEVDVTATVRAALAHYPSDRGLWRVLLRLLFAGRRYDEAALVAREATVRLGAAEEWSRAEASALSEHGEADAAQRIFDRLRFGDTALGLLTPVRNLIRLGRFDKALELAQRPVPAADEPVLWPYRALLWRLIGDERWHLLEGDERLIGVYDLGMSADELTDLAQVLRELHRGSGLLPDQSVRGGTQTDGNLLARAEPAIRALRMTVLDAVAGHIAQLPAAVTGHPTLIENRSPVRIAGSWSVRLSGAGFHVDHVHPHGWLSSAFYVALPPAASAGRQQGWLAFGECRDLLPFLDGFRMVEPVPGRLALFPSTTWHGTRPFPAGERLTVAFDIARPS
jgi:tetratricopeptide (TPR) repeat protein